MTADAPAAAVTAPSPARAEGRGASVADGSTFAPGLRLLGPRVRQDVERLYGVLRTLDDLVDEDDPRAEERVQAVERWAHGMGADAHETPETRALSQLASRHRLPREQLLDFCAGMRHDIAHTSVDSEEDFARYCQQAGGSVGIVLANLLGIAYGEADPAREEAERPRIGGDPTRKEADRPREDATRRRAEAGMAALGRAMQITNILRDIDEDLEHGRIYIPGTLIERFGFPAPGAREALLREMIPRADALYEQGASAIPLLRDGRAAMAVSAALYREILRQIERDGFGARPGRSVVPAWRARLLIARHRTANVIGG